MNNRCYLISWRVTASATPIVVFPGATFTSDAYCAASTGSLIKRCVVFHVDVAICIEGVSLTRIGSQTLNDEINHHCFF